MTDSVGTAKRPEMHVVPEVSTPTVAELEGWNEPVITCNAVSIYYSDFRAVSDVSIGFGKNEISALIGPSGCGKSTVLRCLNRMNDLVPGARVEGRIAYHGQDIYGGDVDPVEVRRRIGMVFQKPNPFPKSIYDNVAYGPRLTGIEGDNMDDLLRRRCARRAVG